MAGRLDDEVGLVTGEASGIGRATAMAFARAGRRSCRPIWLLTAVRRSSVSSKGLEVKLSLSGAMFQRQRRLTR